MLCKRLKTSNSGYHAWSKRSEDRHASKNRKLLESIQLVFHASKRSYGSPRIYKQLKEQGVQCGKNRIAHLMRENSIEAKRFKLRRKFKAKRPTTHIKENLLNRSFSTQELNKTWVSDITSFWTKSGFVHLAIVMDLYSRHIIGWSMQPTMTENIVLDALDMAILRRNTSPKMFHSDQGSQYQSLILKSKLEGLNTIQSMSRKGQCHDNAVAESFFKSLKCELIYRTKLETINKTKLLLFDYIEIFYNRKRLHSTLGYKSPVNYEKLKTTHSGVH
jgi:putative transposase